jgi:hypothetical protein
MGAPYSEEGPWTAVHSCGCESRASSYTERITLTHCPLHEAAPEMFDALVAARHELRDFMPTTAGDTLTMVESALRKAGEP